MHWSSCVLEQSKVQSQTSGFTDVIVRMRLKKNKVTVLRRTYKQIKIWGIWMGDRVLLFCSNSCSAASCLNHIRHGSSWPTYLCGAHPECGCHPPGPAPPHGSLAAPWSHEAGCWGNASFLPLVSASTFFLTLGFLVRRFILPWMPALSLAVLPCLRMNSPSCHSTEKRNNFPGFLYQKCCLHQTSQDGVC